MTDEIEYQKGTMVKDPRDMTNSERAEWQRQCAENARDYLFSIGQPLVYKQPDGHVVAEYKDGRKLVIS
jgi:hypothetical protein